MRGFISLAAVTTMLVGCLPDDENDPDAWDHTCGDGMVTGVEACDDGNQIAGDGCGASCLHIEDLVTVSWSLSTVAGVAQPYPARFATAQLVVQGYNDEPLPCFFEDTCVRAPTGSGLRTATVDADAGEATMFMAVPSSEYVTVELVDADGVGYAKSLPAQQTPYLAPPHLDLYTDGGYMQLAWKLSGIDSQGRVSCNSTGVGSIDVTATPDAGGAPIYMTFDCFDRDIPAAFPSGVARSQVMPAGGYTIATSAYGYGDHRGFATPQHVTIAGATAVTDIGTITIPMPGN
jgi:cysteine-rich repeat protein